MPMYVLPVPGSPVIKQPFPSSHLNSLICASLIGRGNIFRLYLMILMYSFLTSDLVSQNNNIYSSVGISDLPSKFNHLNC